MKETLNTSTEDSVIKNSMASEEAKEYFKLATPMLLTQLAAHATGIISALMTGNYNTVDQAAVAIGNMLFWPAYFGIAGVLFIVTSFVAQFYGAKQIKQIGPIVKQSSEFRFQSSKFQAQFQTLMKQGIPQSIHSSS